MKYKCHYCSEFLKPGVNYTLECDCGNCNLGFEKSGKVDHFFVTFFEKGKDYFLIKEKSGKVRYGFKVNTSYFKYIPSMICDGPYANSKLIIEIDSDIKFDEEGVPQVYTLWEKLDKLKAFS